MLQEIMESYFMVYTTMCIGAIGIFMYLLLGIRYSIIARKTWKIGTEKQELTENLRQRYALCFRMGMNVNNVDKFVDKFVYKQKIMGIMLCTWEKICGQLGMLVGAISVISVCLVYYGNCGQVMQSDYLLNGVLSITMLITCKKLADISTKKEVIHLNLCEYLENIYAVRLEKEKENPNWGNEYKKEIEKLEQKKEKKTIKKKNSKRLELERMKQELVEELKQERLENEKRRLKEKQENIEIKEHEIQIKEEPQEIEQVLKKQIQSFTKETQIEKEKKQEVNEEQLLQEILREYLG